MAEPHFSGATMPALGLGTWFLGEGRRPLAEEEAALLAGIDAGIHLIDTAEMYGSGRAEDLIGRVLTHRGRDDLFLVSKVYPHNAGTQHIFHSCENSLRRMGTDHLDLYLLHWRGSIPLQETIDCMEALIRQGKILRWGVSNFDTDDMKELFSCYNGDHCAVNQVLYHLGSRGIEYELLPWHQAHHVATMAYCPLAQGGSLRRQLLRHPAVLSAADELGLTPIQILLGFVLHQPNMTAIPRTGSVDHALQLAAMADHPLPDEIIEQLSDAFPAPRHKVPLDMQ